MIGLLISANLIQIATYVWRMHSIPPQIPLLYSLPIGEDQLVEWWMIFIIPILMNSLCFLNSAILQKYFSQDIFVRSLTKYANTVIVIVCTYVFLRIIFLVS